MFFSNTNLILLVRFRAHVILSNQSVYYIRLNLMSIEIFYLRKALRTLVRVWGRQRSCAKRVCKPQLGGLEYMVYFRQFCEIRQETL